MKQYTTIEGYVQPKERPRFYKGAAHTGAKTRNFESFIKGKCKDAGFEPMAGRIALVIKIKKKVTNPDRYYRFKSTRPDIDNLVKSVMDGLNGVAYKDDGQVAMVHAQKEYSDEDSLYIMVMNIDTPYDLEDYMDEISDILIYENNDNFYPKEDIAV